jgi:hypothetical protein
MVSDGPIGNGDPHDEIVRLEAQIETLSARIENCHKFILAARIAVAGGAVLLTVLFLGLIRFDPMFLFGAFAALLGGIVVWGSNSSTANEAQEQLAKTEANRRALIGLINLRVIAEQPTLH